MIYREGDHVEVNRQTGELATVWSLAVVIKRIAKNIIWVEYKNMPTGDGESSRDIVDIFYVRPYSSDLQEASSIGPKKIREKKPADHKQQMQEKTKTRLHTKGASDAENNVPHTLHLCTKWAKKSRSRFRNRLKSQECEGTNNERCKDQNTGGEPDDGSIQEIARESEYNYIAMEDHVRVLEINLPLCFNCPLSGEDRKRA